MAKFKYGNPVGVLPMQDIKRLMDSGYITGIDAKYINPASLDVPLSDEAYRLESGFLPLKGQKVRGLIKRVGGIRHDLKNPLEVGVPYLIRIAGKIELPDSVYAYANPKSSTGRINMLCRTLADGESMYDSLSRRGWSGELWVSVVVNSFPVLVSAGQALSQIRLINEKTLLGKFELELELRKPGLLFHPNGKRFAPHEAHIHNNALVLSIMVKRDMFGWECRGSNRLFDLGLVNHYRPSDFFDPVEVTDGSLRMVKDGFYILSTKERIAVPPNLSAELRDIDTRFGEFRSHAAGYIDPGWGWGRDGSEHGRPITLEITPRENMTVVDGQSIARIRYEHMKATPNILYDSARSNYTKQKQGAALSKHFKKR